MKHNQKPFAPEAATDEPASSSHPDLPEFDPVPVRVRHDGITPEKQREYVEALADTGVARYAAACIGVSEQAINRLRRRADARSFDRACEAARRLGARRLHAIAWERAIEGTVKRHYYHGELKSEERVLDNRLLIYLLGKTGHLLDEGEDGRAVAAAWEPFVEAIEAGAEPPVPDPAAPEPEREAGGAAPLDASETCNEVWQNMDGSWWTSWPPPADFDGIEEGPPGAWGYQRSLSDAEQAVIDAEYPDDNADEIAARDAFFGFEGGRADDEDFPLLEAETYETSDTRPSLRG